MVTRSANSQIGMVALVALFLLSNNLQSHYEVSPETNSSDFWFDFFIGEFLGAQRVDPETDTYVRSILHELNCPFAKKLRIRKLSQRAIYGGMTKINACVLSLGDNHYMFISEKWFKKLPDNQKRFLIGHEAMHLMYEHVEKSSRILLPATILPFIIAGTTYHLGKKLPMLSRLGVVITSYVTSSIVSRLLFGVFEKKMARAHEFQADREAALKLNCVQGGLDLMHTFMSIQKEHEADLPQWDWCKKKRAFFRCLSKPFHTHPPVTDRIRQLEQLKKRRAKTTSALKCS